MAQEFIIKGVKYFTQRDNKIDPSVTCFPTSMAMVIDYLLTQDKLTKKAIGCPDNMQIEDYLDQVVNSKEITDWMKANTSFWGSWIWDYKRRTVYPVEAQMFNLLMNPLGYKAEFNDQKTYTELCDLLEKEKIPFVVGGNFSSVSKVQGHMNAFVGFNKTGMRQLYVMDPYGNALTGYTNTDGSYLIYGTKFFCDKADKIKAIIVTKIKA